MDQHSRGVCSIDDIALSVLSCVIGHNKTAGKILLDAGGLALSKDRSADRFCPGIGFGQLCRADGTVVPGLHVTAVSQEHGHVCIRDANDYTRFPIGSKVRILPVHACMTAAAYDHFNVVEGGEVRAIWERVNGW